MEIGHTFTECEQSRREPGLLHKELADRERKLRETRIRSIHEIEDLKRAHELRVDEFSRGILVENQNTINEHMAKIQELQNEVNCMYDSMDWEKTRSVLVPTWAYTLARGGSVLVLTVLRVCCRVAVRVSVSIPVSARFTQPRWPFNLCSHPTLAMASPWDDRSTGGPRGNSFENLDRPRGMQRHSVG